MDADLIMDMRPNSLEDGMDLLPNSLEDGMDLLPNSLEDSELDKLFNIIKSGLKTKAKLEEKRKLVNSMLPLDKYKLLHRFLSPRENAPQATILNCLRVFLDENTKYIGFQQSTSDQEFIKSILEIIPKYCPNIETIDFGKLLIQHKNKENFKYFLKQIKNLKSLRVKCLNKCVIRELLIQEDFNLHDQDVKIALLKIDNINAFQLSANDFRRLLKLPLNLKSFGDFQSLTPAFNSYRDDDEIVQKLSNITELYDFETNLTAIENIVRFCPNTKKICLANPQRQVIENLCKFPLLTEIKLTSMYTDLVSELINLLKIIGKQIKKMEVFFPDHIELDPNILRELCPELIQLEIMR